MKRDCSHKVSPGGGATPPTITSPTSPSAWQETTWMIFEDRMGGLLVYLLEAQVMTSHGAAASASLGRRACDQRRGTDPPHSCRQMLLWRGGIRGVGRVSLCRELPLLQLPADDRFGVQAVRWNRAREARDHKGRDRAYDLRRRRRQQYPLQDLRLAPLFGRPRQAPSFTSPWERSSTIRPYGLRTIFSSGSKAPWFTIADDLPQYEEHVPPSGPRGG